MNTTLIKARLISFGYEAGTLAVSAILGMLVSPQFATVLQANFGEGMATSIILLVVSGTVKHIRNLKVIKSMTLGTSRGESGEPFVLI